MAQHAAQLQPSDNGWVTSHGAGSLAMSHTYLFQPALWTGSGTFWCADGQPLLAECRTEVAHRTECWLLSGTLKVTGLAAGGVRECLLDRGLTKWSRLNRT